MKKEFNGLIIVNKPKNFTSRDVVNKLVRIFGTKKIGHTGTLDPIATGVLICTVGKCTKLNDYLTSNYKEYVAEMKLGIETDTLDITGKILKTGQNIFSKDLIEKTFQKFRGTYLQKVPAYSAVKVNGKKLYEYAREGLNVDLPERNVEIKELEIISINDDIIKFKCLVSKGTYIRSLIRDIGHELKSFGTMTSLIRTKQGNFSIDDAYTIEQIENNQFKFLIPEELLNNLETIICDDELYKKISNGVPQEYNSTSEYIIYKYHDKVIAMYKKINTKFRMYIMF